MESAARATSVLPCLCVTLWPTQVHKYSLAVPTCCCGRVDNCCGATCCKPALIMDITGPDGQMVANAVKSYGGSGCAALCRCM